MESLAALYKIILLPYKNVPATSWPVFKWMLC